MKAVVAAFNQEKALSRGLLRDYEPFEALLSTGFRARFTRMRRERRRRQEQERARRRQQERGRGARGRGQLKYLHSDK